MARSHKASKRSEKDAIAFEDQGSCGDGGSRSIRAALADSTFRHALEVVGAGYRLGDKDRFQEVCLRGLLAEAEGRYDGALGNPLGFLMGIARNVELEARRAKRQRRFEGRVVCEVGYINDTSTRMADEEEREFLKNLLLGLAERDRILVLRRFGVGCEGAGDIGFTGAERCRVCRALKRLRKASREELEDS